MRVTEGASPQLRQVLPVQGLGAGAMGARTWQAWPGPENIFAMLTLYKAPWGLPPRTMLQVRSSRAPELARRAG